MLAALASCLDARSLGGRWLVRIDDLDAPRCLPGMADEHLRVLEALGFEWDGPVVRQSQRIARYHEAMASLRSRGLAYDCSCSRRELANGREGSAYRGACRGGPAGTAPWALRFRYDLVPVGPFEDLVQGRCDPGSLDAGDPVICRRDGLPAYQLAVVLDDNDASVTRVVRGADLLPSTAWQRSLQRALGCPEPRYGHIPLLLEPGGEKLSKSRRALPLAADAAGPLLLRGLELLGQQPPGELIGGTPPQIWRWALTHWKVEPLAGRAAMALPPGLY